jgi:hypothetical protein
VRPLIRLIDKAEAVLTVPWELFHSGGYDFQDDMEDPIVFPAASNPDIMYLDDL